MIVAPLVTPGPDLTPAQLARYSRHLLVPGMGIDAQRRLLAARVAVVGAGGLGSPIIAYLAAAGVGHLTVIDDDVVDSSNLQRQIIHRDDALGTSKAHSAARFATGLNPDVTVDALEIRITPDTARDVLDGHHLVLDGADNFPTRYAVSDACADLGLPAVWGAVLRFDAQVSCFVPGVPDAVTLRDLYPFPPRPEDVPSCAEAGVLGALAGQVGSIMAAEAIKLICGIGAPLVGRILLIDALSQRTREVPLRPTADAPLPEPSPEGRPTFRILSVEEVAAILPDPDRPTLLDVREPAEHALGTLPGSLPVPLADVLSWVDLSGLPVGPVVVYCTTGPRARRAAAHLRALGHTDVRLMDGGMSAWAELIDPRYPRY